ncbi:MAG TPA: DUF4129 domain-containing protein [Pseudomonas sp.]|jgi:hypothetical protein
MRLTDASVTIRPRNPWEAIDLGVLLAREHRGLLMTSWAIVTLPVFALLSLGLWNYPTLAIVVFWWLKPAFEPLPLLILSQALFGSTPTLKNALKAWLRLLRPQLLPAITWRRFGLGRSFTLPVQQLENLSGTQRTLRIGVLSQKDLRAARCLTMVGSALEVCLWIGMVLMFYALIPQQVEIDWSWQSVVAIEGSWNWLEHLTNAFYALVLVVWEPIYVACGFTLYLNRRTALEAWDIELVLRRLRQRLIGSAYLLVLGAGIILTTLAPPTWATESDQSCPVPLQQEQTVQKEPGPNSARLTHQALSSEAARQQIKAVLEQPPFKNPKTVSGWRFADENPKSSAAKADHPANAPLKWLAWLFTASRIAAEMFKVLLWAGVIALAGLVIWRYRAWFNTLVNSKTPKRRRVSGAPEQMFGLEISAQSLPDDVAGSAEQLWSSHPREALGLLYRALLSRLLLDYRLPLRSADTEGEVLERIAHLNHQPLHDFSINLTRHWQNLAYGHQLPPTHVRQELCDNWRQLFNTEGRR